MPGFLPSFPMTKQEYEAKALLLGYQYSDVTHLFYDEGAYNVYDPDTLQHLWALSKEERFALIPEAFKELAMAREQKYKHYLRR
jgi:hypothetical protein